MKGSLYESAGLVSDYVAKIFLIHILTNNILKIYRKFFIGT